MLGSHEEAEDALQHVIRLARTVICSPPTASRSTCKAWLYTIARNRCLSMLRARREDARSTDAER